MRTARKRSSGIDHLVFEHRGRGGCLGGGLDCTPIRTFVRTRTNESLEG